ncbi:sterol delta-7-reductase [Planoprotostelium fungivorum]|uniref:7-dehydrocholesterol reductase n=1 Tax=Planoprotostelium fungivorum TaxID=1890364 RepID=A0A2P6MTZ1_9EUKA|nr:sterol delta-7-reductase [Planoprotostelium fungivorum]
MRSRCSLLSSVPTAFSRGPHTNSSMTKQKDAKAAKWTEAKVDETPFGLPHWVHTVFVPLFIMTSTFFTAPTVWIICTAFKGDLVEFVQNLHKVPLLWPSPTFEAAKIIGWFAALNVALLLLVPSKRLLGPITPEGNQPVYRLNGVSCFLLNHVILYIGGAVFKLYNLGIVYDHLGSILVTLSYFALLGCFLLYVKGRLAPTNKDASVTGNPIMDYYWGVELHPAVLGVSLKQIANCRLGMMCWSVMLWSYLFKQAELYGSVSNSMILSVVLQSVYCLKFFHWEGGYFHTLDIMHDRFGYYIFWGVMVWIPSVYTLTGMWLVEHPIELSPVYFYSVLAFGLFSIYVNYEADAQRTSRSPPQLCRATQGKCKIWGKDPEMITATYYTAEGTPRTNLLLVSGWWAVARHFHYVPELALSLAWSLPAQYGGFIPYFYLVYLTVLLVHRSGRDELRCSDKYGKDWEKYKARVPYRMVPFLY